MKSYLARRIDNLEARAVPSSLDYLIVCSESDIPPGHDGSVIITGVPRGWNCVASEACVS